MLAGVTCIKVVGPSAPLGLSRSIQLLHLDQASVEDFISNLTDRHSSTLGNDKRISCCRGANDTNYFM